MRRHLGWVVGPGIAIAAALRVATGCASATPQEKAAAAEATYTADLLACVEASETITESRACRTKVRERWHVDAGGSR